METFPTLSFESHKHNIPDHGGRRPSTLSAFSSEQKALFSDRIQIFLCSSTIPEAHIPE